MPTSQRVSAIIVVAVALLGAIYTVVSGNEPLLGLDLQGGVSVVLEPTGASEGQPGREVTEEALDLTVELLRARIDEIGVAEPEISRQGNNIVVGLPGLVEEQEQALDRLRQTAELRFRPVISDLPPAGLTLEELAPATEDQPEPGTEPEGSSSTGAESSSADTGGSGATSGDEESLVATGGRFGPVFQAQTTTTETTGTTETSEPVGTTDSTEATGTTEADQTTTTGGTDGTEGETPDGAQPAPIGENPLEGCTIDGNTPDDEDTLDAYVALSDSDGLRYCLGPALVDDRPLTGDMVETASVGLNPGIGWQVNPTFNSGENGIDRFNEIGALCFVRDPAVCPTGRLAVVLDHEVISAPQINAGSFSRDQIVISGSSRTRSRRTRPAGWPRPCDSARCRSSSWPRKPAPFRPPSATTCCDPA